MLQILATLTHWIKEYFVNAIHPSLIYSIISYSEAIIFNMLPTAVLLRVYQCKYQKQSWDNSPQKNISIVKNDLKIYVTS